MTQILFRVILDFQTAVTQCGIMRYKIAAPTSLSPNFSGIQIRGEYRLLHKMRNALEDN